MSVWGLSGHNAITVGCSGAGSSSAVYGQMEERVATAAESKKDVMIPYSGVVGSLVKEQPKTVGNCYVVLAVSTSSSSSIGSSL